MLYALAADPFPTAEISFMVFGLGFFILITFVLLKILFNENDRDYSRKVNEAREFGYEPSRLYNEVVATAPPRRKRNKPKKIE